MKPSRWILLGLVVAGGIAVRLLTRNATTAPEAGACGPPGRLIAGP